MSTAINIFFKWQINSSKFLYLVKHNFTYSNKSTWGFISEELSKTEEEAIRLNVLSLNEETYAEVFNYMRDEVLAKDKYGKYLTLLDYSCYYVKNDCSSLLDKTIEKKPMFKTIVTTTTRTVNSGENADTKVDIEETDVLGTQTLKLNFDFAIPKGRDGIDGINGHDGKDGKDGKSGSNAFTKTVMIYHTCKRDNKGNIVRDDLGNIMPPEKPVGGSWDAEKNKVTPPTGWVLYDAVEAPVFMSTKSFCGVSEIDNNEEWSVPVQITGADGVAGKDGESIQFVFCPTNDDITNAVWVSNRDIGEDEVLPTYKMSGKLYEFVDNAVGVDATTKSEYYCFRTKKSDTWGDWSGPYLWSRYGENGQDGDSVEYIFYLTSTELSEKELISPAPDTWEFNEEYQMKEWVPKTGGWSDNPASVTAENPYLYVSIRKYDGTTKKWGKFSKPTLWCKYGKDGINGEMGKRGRMLYPAGEWNATTTYKVENNASPYVSIFNDTTNKIEYFYLNIESEEGVKNVNPIEEEEPKKWAKMESFDALYTDLIVANYGTIGGAVFYNDSQSNKFLFSTQGHCAITSYHGTDLEPSNAYRYFLFDKDPDSVKNQMIDNYYEYENHISDGKYLDVIKNKSVFVPNVLINFSTGDTWFGCGSTLFKQNGDGELANGTINWKQKENGDTDFNIKGTFKTYDKNNNPTAEVGNIEKEDFTYEEIDENGKTITVTEEKQPILKCNVISDNNSTGDSVEYVPFIRVSGGYYPALRASISSIGTTTYWNNDQVILIRKDLIEIVLNKTGKDKAVYSVDDANATLSHLKSKLDYLIANFDKNSNEKYSLNTYINELKKDDGYEPFLLTKGSNIFTETQEANRYGRYDIESELFSVAYTGDYKTTNEEGQEVTETADGNNGGYLYYSCRPKIDDTTYLDAHLTMPVNKIKSDLNNVDKKDLKPIDYNELTVIGGNFIVIEYLNNFNLKLTNAILNIDTGEFYLPFIDEEMFNKDKSKNTHFNYNNDKINQIDFAVALPLGTTGTNIKVKDEDFKKNISTVGSTKIESGNVVQESLNFYTYSVSYWVTIIGSDGEPKSEPIEITIYSPSFKNMTETKNNKIQIKGSHVVNVIKNEIKDEGKQENIGTVIYDDGTITANYIYANNGVFKGRIQSEGIFNGELDSVRGSAETLNIKNAVIENLEYNNDVFEINIDKSVRDVCGKSYKLITKSYWGQHSSYTYSGEHYLYNDYITLGPNDTICIPKIEAYLQRYTPRKKNNYASGYLPYVGLTIVAYREGNNTNILDTGISTYYSYIDSHRYRHTATSNKGYVYTNTTDKDEKIKIEIKATYSVWMECKQGCDWAAVTLSIYPQNTTTTVNVTDKDNKSVSKTITSSNIIVIGEETETYPKIVIAKDGIAFKTKKGSMLITENGFEFLDPSGNPGKVFNDLCVQK